MAAMPCAAQMEEDLSKFIGPVMPLIFSGFKASELFDYMDFNSAGPKFEMDISFSPFYDKNKKISLEEFILNGGRLLFVDRLRDGRKTQN